MQKLIAILFFCLLCSATMLQGVQLQVDVVEQLADSDKGKEAKPEKKEGKEFIAGCFKKLYQEKLSIPYYLHDVNNWRPQPLLTKLSPPPDVIC